jgi:hypothetical protein
MPVGEAMRIEREHLLPLCGFPGYFGIDRNTLLLKPTRGAGIVVIRPNFPRGNGCHPGRTIRIRSRNFSDRVNCSIHAMELY